MIPKNIFVIAVNTRHRHSEGFSPKNLMRSFARSG